MGKSILFLFLTCFLQVTTYSQSIKDSLTIRRIYTEALTNSTSYKSLEYLCKKIGNRLSGSPQAAKAVNWGKVEMEKVSDKVTLQEVMVPHWVRGPKETAILTIDGSTKQNIEILALGGSIATPKGGLSAPILLI